MIFKSIGDIHEHDINRLFLSRSQPLLPYGSGLLPNGNGLLPRGQYILPNRKSPNSIIEFIESIHEPEEEYEISESGSEVSTPPLLSPKLTPELTPEDVDIFGDKESEALEEKSEVEHTPVKGKSTPIIKSLVKSDANISETNKIIDQVNAISGKIDDAVESMNVDSDSIYYQEVNKYIDELKESVERIRELQNDINNGVYNS
jgi:hypothetical protein